MFKAGLALFLVTPGILLAQDASQKALAPLSDAVAISSMSAAAQHGGAAQSAVNKLPDAPRGSLTASYVYVYNDAQNGPNRSFMGWALVPELNVVSHLGIQGDFESLYGKAVYPGISRFLIASGPVYYLAPRSKITPFVFAEGGEMRLTSKAVSYSDWNPIVKGGFGVNYKVSHDFSFQLIPGEYLGQYQDDHEWNHSFTARAGFTLNFVPRA
jgi:hypothetical protein